MLKLCLIDGFVPDKICWDTDDGMFDDILVIVDAETESDCETAGEDESFHKADFCKLQHWYEALFQVGWEQQK